MKHALNRALLAAILSLWLTTSAWAGFDEGFAAYQRDDYATAFEEWLPIAEQGHAAAQKYLGTMYEFGQGVSQDYAEAVKWYRLAAEQGIAFAQYNLGGMYRKGRGVQQDNAEAVKWWRLAAEQGHDDAQYNLGGMYLNGKGVSQDYIQAHMWSSVAAAKGNENGRINRDIIAKSMTPADISEVQRLAREWIEEHRE